MNLVRLALAAALLTGCATVRENAGVCQSPPPLRNEVIPTAPPAEFTQTWQPGYWDWNGSTYAWRDGRWIKSQGGSNQWLRGFWDRPVTPGPCVWNPAHWV